MLSRAATRTTTSLVTRRGFHATRARLSSPYHYPEGAYSNLPFNPHSKWFGPGFWAFMATGFFAPFGIAGECFPGTLPGYCPGEEHCRWRVWTFTDIASSHSLPDLQAVSVLLPLLPFRSAHEVSRHVTQDARDVGLECTIQL